ncbi:MAG: RNA 2'-phosphotransferase [Selenomonadaceae bacterium]|nr:RNA 2'-phosphotransferase [Selenomonadaceae bacterium]
MSRRNTSKFLSLILRHKPQLVGLELDEHGWAQVDELCRLTDFDRATLEQIVARDDKRRYSFSDDGRLIRANQGHSIPVDVELAELEPPEILFHGTGEKSVASIKLRGLLKMSRLYVHLSADIETARKVGMRHGAPKIFRVQSLRMFRDGRKFFRSVNGVWLTEHVPANYLEEIF